VDGTDGHVTLGGCRTTMKTWRTEAAMLTRQHYSRTFAIAFAALGTSTSFVIIV
jgi:hypothetical protein